MAKAAFDTGANTANATALTIIVPNPCDLLAFVFSEGADAAPVMSDNKSNAYTLIGTRQISGATPGYLHIFRAFKKIGGTVVITATKANGNSSLIVMNILGSETLKVVEAEQKAGQSSDPITVRPINGGNLLVAVMAAGYPDREVIFSYPAGWTEFTSISHEVGPEWAMGVAYLLTNSRGEFEFSSSIDEGTEDPPYAVTLLNLANFANPIVGTPVLNAMTGMSGMYVGDGL